MHGLIASQGLGQFYDLQEGGVAPAPSTVFQKRDYAWLEELLPVSPGALSLEVQGMSCLGCAWLIERLFQRKPGAQQIFVDPGLGKLEMRWQPAVFDVLGFVRELQSFGYLVGPPGKNGAPANRGMNLRLGVCAALAMNTMLFTLPRYLGMEATFPFAELFARLTLVFGTLSFLIGGSYFFVRTWHSLRQRVLHIDLPISLGLLAAYAGSVTAWIQNAQGFVYFDFVAVFTFLMLSGRWLQQKVIERNRRQLLASQAAPPKVRLASGPTVAAAQIKAGDIFLVAPGQFIPVLARLESPQAVLGMEWINGESETAIVPRGRLVAAGAVNCGAEAIVLEAREVWADSLLAKLLRIAPSGTSRNLVVERFLRYYIAIILGLASAGFLGWWAGTGSLLGAFQVLISILVVSCPCASGIALPLCRDLAAARLRQLGVFLRDGEIWSRLERVRKIIFDKTGTLTLETISLLNPEALQALSEQERAVLLALIFDNAHPVSGCLREQLLADQVVPSLIGTVTETIGFGLTTEGGGECWRLGRVGWAMAPDSAGVPPGSSAECVFTRNGDVLAEFRFGEVERQDARDELDALRSTGLEIFVLSGDRAGKVAAMADRLHLPHDQCLAELSPQAKADYLKGLDDRDTLYLGDGANDSLAFDVAWVSGTPAVDRGLLEQKASFYFLGRSLRGLRSLLAMAALRRKAARRVVGFAVVYNAIAVALCLAGAMSPLLAAILMPASSLVSLGMVLLTFGLPRKTATRSGPAQSTPANFTDSQPVPPPSEPLGASIPSHS